MLKKQYLKTKPVCKVTFSLPAFAARGAKEVKLLGDFNNWSPEAAVAMKPAKDEYKAVLELETGRTYQFRYLIDAAYWENDHEADRYVPSPYSGVDNSVVVVEAQPAVAPAKGRKANAQKAAPKAKKAVTAKKKTKTAKKEDLRKIEGIGPKIAGLLNEAGIMTFSDLAKAKKTKVQKVLAAAGPRYKMHDPATWMEQAKLAAAGKWEQLDALQKELKGGKRKK